MLLVSMRSDVCYIYQSWLCKWTIRQSYFMLVLFVYYIKRAVSFYIGYCNILRCLMEQDWHLKVSLSQPDNHYKLFAFSRLLHRLLYIISFDMVVELRQSWSVWLMKSVNRLMLGNYFIWQLSVAASYQFVYCRNIAYPAKCPHAQWSSKRK